MSVSFEEEVSQFLSLCLSVITERHRTAEDGEHDTEGQIWGEETKRSLFLSTTSVSSVIATKRKTGNDVIHLIMYLCACLLDDANWSEVCEWSDEEVSVLSVFYFDFVV